MKHLALFLVLLMLFTSVFSVTSLAQGYQQQLPVEPTFETMEEVHANGPALFGPVYNREFVTDPAMETYPEGTTYVYRSNTYTGLTAGYRMNTNLLVYTDEEIADKDAALNYLKGLGITDMIDEAGGSAVLVTPVDKAAGFGAADQYAYYKLQAAMCNLGGGVWGGAGYIDNFYYGGVTNRYLIGIGGGAAFLCNSVAPQLDYIGRIAGMMLVNADMEQILDVAVPVPVYLVNPSEQAADKFIEVNGAYASEILEGKTVYFNQQFPVRKVVVADEGKELADYVKDAYYSLLIKAMRTPVVKSGLFTPAGEYSGYAFSQAPYTLTARNPILNGKTPDGIVVTEHQEERFSEFQAENGEYLNTWYEFLPEEVLSGTAAEHSIPLILSNHGGGDDPVQATDELGLITLAGRERLAVVAPRYATDVPGAGIFGPSPFDVNGKALPALVRYMLETYPALDPGRVYVTGYSMGGAATVEAVECVPELFAAAVPMAAGTPWGLHVPTEEEIAAFEKVDVAVMFTTSQYDLDGAYNQAEGILGQGYQDAISLFSGFNGLGKIEYDFEKYPTVGFKTDRIVTKLLNDEYENRTWYKNNEAGAPVLAVSFTELLPHGLHPDYGMDLAWNYMKQFSRNTETGELVYNPSAK